MSIKLAVQLQHRGYSIFSDGEFIVIVNIVALGISNEFIGFADQSRSSRIKRLSTHLRVDSALNLNYIWFRTFIQSWIVYTKLHVVYNAQHTCYWTLFSCTAHGTYPSILRNTWLFVFDISVYLMDVS